ncbi:MAG: LPS assembly lipoprotein LptE [Cucumibacter sp.]
MWSSSFRSLLAFGLLALLGGCSLTPVYQSGGADPSVMNRIAFAEPPSRAEQIIYQALKFALGTGEGATLVFTVATDSEISEVSQVASADPATPYALEMTAHYTLVDNADPETPLLDETRNAAATFTRGPQQLANAAAETDAEERAATRLADIIRARLIVYLSTGQ